MVSERWITIGTVTSGYQIIRNCGFPNAFRMVWYGRVNWNQPVQFLKWQDILWAVKRRLEFAGLQPLAIASAIPRAATGVHLRVLVKRHPEGRLWRAR